MRIQRLAILAAAGLALGAASLSAGTAPVGAGQPSGLAGLLDCDPNTGEQIVTWTFQNFTGLDADITSVALDSSGLTAGTVASAAVILAPDPTPSLGSSSGFTTASADAVGALTLTIHWFNASSQQDTISVASVTVLGECTVETTTTVVDTTAVDTTVVNTTAAPTTAAPTTAILGAGGQGRIPKTGSDPTIAWLGLAFVTAGGALLAVRRRALRNS